MLWTFFKLYHGTVVAHDIITTNNLSEGRSLSLVEMDMKLRGHKIELKCKQNKPMVRP